MKKVYVVVSSLGNVWGVYPTRTKAEVAKLRCKEVGRALGLTSHVKICKREIKE